MIFEQTPFPALSSFAWGWFRRPVATVPSTELARRLIARLDGCWNWLSVGCFRRAGLLDGWLAGLPGCGDERRVACWLLAWRSFGWLLCLLADGLGWLECL